MGRLKFYQKERELFPEEFKMMITSQKEVIKIINKLTRHYKLSKLRIVFTKRKVNSGTCWKSGKVSFHESEFSIGIVCHEVGHHWLYCKTGKSSHSKKLMSKIKRLILYCRKNNYWGFIKEIEIEEMNKWYWCSVGFKPEDVANGKCEKYNDFQYGCHSCSDWKLMSMEEILNGQKKEMV